MSSHTKGSIFTITGAVLLMLTVVIRHTSTDAATVPWTETYLPIAGFFLIIIGMYFSAKARGESKA